MGSFGLGTSESFAEYSPQTADGDSVNQRGKGNTVSKGALSKAVGNRGKLIESGGVEIGKGAKLSTLDFGKSKVKGNISVTINEGAGDLVGAVKSLATKVGDTLQSTVGQIIPLAENKQTGGESGQNKTVLWVVLAALAMLGFVFYKKR